jgi:hypothetical protein
VLPGPEAEAALELHGRRGHASNINGPYARVPGAGCGGRPVFCHTNPIPDGFGESSGRRLFL